MLESKMFEIRDVGTFIPVLCVKMKPEGAGGYLLRRAGFGRDSDSIQLVWISAGKTEYDPFVWGDRTIFTAHLYIMDNWDKLHDGAVIDVEYILEEKDGQKISERFM
jgi:hypothetical protein